MKLFEIFKKSTESQPNTPLNSPLPQSTEATSYFDRPQIAIDCRNLKELDYYLDKLLVDDENVNKPKSKKIYSTKVQKSTLQSVICPLISEKLMDKIFNVYVSSAGKDDQIEIRHFFTGLSACCDGSTDDKLVYCFRLFDEDDDGSLSYTELIQMLETIYKIADIHSKLIKSTSTMLTLSRVLPPELSIRVSKFSNGDQASIQAMHETKSLASTFKTHQESLESSASYSNVPKRIFNDSSSINFQHRISMSSLPDTHSMRSKRMSIKGLPQFENINKMLKSFSTGIHHEQSLHTLAGSTDSLSPSKSGSADQLVETTPAKQIIKRNKTASAVTTAEELATIIYTSLQLEKTEIISLGQYVQWIHKNPHAMKFLDKVKHIASTGGRQTHLANEERHIIENLCELWQPKVGEECFLMSSKWWKLWLNYVNSDSESIEESQESIGDDPPGSVDNYDLICSREEAIDITDFPFLRDNLLESVDYVIVSKAMWNALLNWYGGGPQIVRQIKAINPEFVQRRKSILLQSISTQFSLFSRDDLELDLYPLVLHLGSIKDRKIVSRCVCSGEILLNDLRELACAQLNINYAANIKVWVSYRNTEIVALDGEEVTLHELGLTSGYKVFIDGKPKHERTLSVAIVSNWLSRVGAASVNSSTAPSSPGFSSGTGHVGLSNLGNTCFLNSALQCLLHTYPLVSYFNQEFHAEDFQHYETDGALTQEFVKLSKQYWQARNNSHISPQSLRMALIKKAPQFGGMEQHDSQEALGLLLDYLHMDLNLIKNKVSKENPDYNKHTDLELSTIYWENHLLRDCSLIVELFQGQFKSHTQCIECKHEIVKFHPFMFLSLPLPENHFRMLEMVLVPRKGHPTRFKVKIEKHSTLAHLMPKVADIPGLTKSESFYVADVQLHYIFGFLKASTPISEIRDRDQIYLYESFGDEETASNHSDIRITLLQRRSKGEWTISGKRPKLALFGTPLLKKLRVAAGKNVTGRDLYDFIAECLSESYSELDSLFKEIAKKANAKESQTLSKQKQQETTPFVIRRVDHNGMTCSLCTDIYSTELACTGCMVEAGDEPVILGDSETLAVEWRNVRQKKLLAEIERILETVKIDQSCQLQSAFSSENSISLDDVLIEYEKVEWMGKNDFYCPKCKQNQPGVKRETVWKFPPLLMIQLKRFSYTMYGCIKNDASVQFPIQSFNVAPYLTPNAENGRRNLMDLLPMLKQDNSHQPLSHDWKSPERYYDLFGVISHIGSFYDGHYIAHAKDQEGGKWFCFNDEDVREWTPSSEQIQSTHGYVMFYKQRNMPTIESLRQKVRENAQRLGQAIEVKKTASTT